MLIKLANNKEIIKSTALDNRNLFRWAGRKLYETALQLNADRWILEISLFCVYIYTSTLHKPKVSWWVT